MKALMGAAAVMGAAFHSTKNMRGYYQLYKNYFKHFSECHPKLLEEECKVIFEMKNFEKAYGDFRSQVYEKTFVVRLLEYTWGLSDNYTDNALQNMQGGFLILGYHSAREQGDEEYCNVMACTEGIALDFAEKMMDDSKENHPLWKTSICTASHLNWQAVPVSCLGDGTYSGWLITFQWKSELHNCLQDHYDEKWKTPSPHTY